jgi:glycosyltransferase involved in cell wall biosynthesis
MAWCALRGSRAEMTRVVYWNNIPAPYMVERFDALARRGNLDFEAWFSARTESDRSWKVDESQWAFSYRYLPSVELGTSALALPSPLLRGRAPDVLVSLYAGADFVAGSTLARRRGARIAFWVEVTYDAWVKRRRWKEAVKARILPAADGILTAGDDGRSFARRYGVSDDRIHHVPHVVDFERLARGARLAEGERDRLRAELGVRGVTFVYVGRLWAGKGLTYLLDAFGGLQQRDVGEVSLLLVGDGRDEDELRAHALAQGLRNVVFSGFQGDDVLPRLYAASDVFVFPTLGDPFGMVVPEAMACGLPVVATTAAGEISERVAEGVNGFLVAPGSSDQLLERMTVLARDEGLRAAMGAASIRKVAWQSPDAWADAFERALDKVLAMPRTSDSRSAGPLLGPKAGAHSE